MNCTNSFWKPTKVRVMRIRVGNLCLQNEENIFAIKKWVPRLPRTSASWAFQLHLRTMKTISYWFTVTNQSLCVRCMTKVGWENYLIDCLKTHWSPVTKRSFRRPAINFLANYVKGKFNDSKKVIRKSYLTWMRSRKEC